MKWSEGISIDFGPLRYVFWCCGSIFHQLFTFIQIFSVRTVLSNVKVPLIWFWLILILIFQVSVSNDLKYDAERDLRDIGAHGVDVHFLSKMKYGKINSSINGYVKKGVMYSTYSAVSLW